VLPALLIADGESRVRITGGTHNNASPPFDFLARSFLPLLARMGANVQLELASYGFYPRGGGEIRSRIVPTKQLGALELTTRGALLRGYAEAYVAAIPLHVAQRELEVIRRRLGFPQSDLLLRALPNDVGPGNAVTITLEYEHVTEVFTGFGAKGVPAETVAERAAEDARVYLAASAPVDEHLADQLLLPMALGSGGSFIARTVTPHLRSNAAVIERFTISEWRPCPQAIAFEVRIAARRGGSAEQSSQLVDRVQRAVASGRRRSPRSQPRLEPRAGADPGGKGGAGRPGVVVGPGAC
jgi:RNA 3'-terminal phosphate cyclase (ATP)